jgi:serine/threonine protein kinase
MTSQQSNTPSIGPSWPDEIQSYRIGRVLGHGSFSHVCQCTHVSTGCIYAIKIFPKSNFRRSGDQARFQREIDTMAYLTHENLVRLYDLFWDDINFYMVTDLCPGGDLYHYIVSHHRLDESTAAIIFGQLLRAIAYCHSFSVSHRDIKPENILITEFPRVKIGDFGLCGFISQGKLMDTFCGSPSYCAPECFCQNKYDGRKSDVWSLGVVLYVMVAGRFPWDVANSSMMLRQILQRKMKIPPHISPACSALISRMLDPIPSSRIGVEEILSHPWVAEFRSSIPTPIGKKIETFFAGLPSAQRHNSIESISRASARFAKHSENGILSPFDNRQTVNESGLPQLVVAPASLRSRKRIGRPGQFYSLAQNRQRSAGALLSKLVRPVLSQSRLATISEDDSE